MDMFSTFCHEIDNGIFDEVEGATYSGAERLIIGTKPFVVTKKIAPAGKITKEQLTELLVRLHQGRQQKLRDESS